MLLKFSVFLILPELFLLRDAIVSAIDDQLNDSNNLSNHTFVIAAATIYCHEKNYESALRVLYSDDHIER